MIRENKIPPCYPNLDGTQCLQSSLRMALEHFNPDKSWQWGELDALTGKESGCTSWTPRTYVELNKMSYDVVIYDHIDYQTLTQDPEKYFTEKFSAEYAAITLKLTNMPMLMRDINDLAAAKDIELHQENYDDAIIKDHIRNGYLVIAWVDRKKIHDAPGECYPHYVLIYDFDDAGVFMHDSGDENENTHVPSLHVPWEKLNIANKMNEQGEVGEAFAFRPRKE